ncbi:MAG: SDR family oxidoreductase [Saprospiraceae bacterium]|nr:SDR family oxidoreductase [Saprospiraceae bacterium]
MYTLERSSFQDKCAIITGATSGMGKQIALDLARQGANVIANGRNFEAGALLEQEGGDTLTFKNGDVSDPEINRSLVKAATDQFGKIDHIVTCAGALGIGKITEVAEQTWKETFATNVHSVFYLLKEALPNMSKGGSIVLMGSVAAFHAFPNHPAYSASKGALIALVRQIALDYGPDIRINLVCPAQVKTPLLEDSVRAFPNPQRILEDTAAKLPLKRLGTTTDISNMTQFLLSEQSAWVTGSCFNIDGGFLAT